MTPIHAGAGRGYGIVDLPIQRDSLGYPEIWASSFKGALKTHLIKIYDSDQNMKNCIYAFLGSEPGEEITYPGIAMICNLVPVALPVPSATHGFLYVTTPYLLSKVRSYLELVEVSDTVRTFNPDLYNEVKRLIEVLLSEARNLGDNEVLAPGMAEREVNIVTWSFIRREISVPRISTTKVDELHPLYQVKDIGSSIVVVNDRIGKHIIEASIQRIQRVRLDRYTKTVARGALWSEEYLPMGTLFVGAISLQNPLVVAKGLEERKDIVEKYRTLSRKLDEILKQIDGMHLVVGGRETIGRGVMKLKLSTPPRRGS